MPYFEEDLKDLETLLDDLEEGPAALIEHSDGDPLLYILPRISKKALLVY
jgi:hypothetical protein